MGRQRLMILGAGKLQVPIITLAKKMHLETLVVSTPGKFPGFSIADHSYYVDVLDKETILEIARKEKISGILTDQTDLPVPTVAYVAERSGLPGIGYECAVRITNKLKSRQHCRLMGFPIPNYFSVSSLDEAFDAADVLGFPLVVKPCMNQGARGVSKVFHSDELQEKYYGALHHSKNGIVLLEEFIPGQLVVVVGFISNYRCTNVYMGDHAHFDLPSLFIQRHTFAPTVLDDKIKQRILDFNIRLFESFGPKFGIGFSEIVVNVETSEFWLIESAIRGPGGLISSHVIPLSCGIDVLPLLIDLATGRRTDVLIDDRAFVHRAAGNVYFYLQEGIIRCIRGFEELSCMPNVCTAGLGRLELGQHIHRMCDMTGRQGPVVFWGNDRESCEQTIGRIMQILDVWVETPKGNAGIMWQ